MRKLKSSYFFTIILILFFFQCNFGAENWFAIKTKQFEIYGNVSQSELINTAEKLENFHQIFARNFPKSEIKIPFQTKIIVLKDSETINRFKLNLKQSDDYFLTADDVNYGIIQLNDSQTFARVVTGYSKFLLENNFGRNVIPTWLYEGLGEYFQGINHLGNNRFEFVNSPNNVEILQKNQIPLKILLETDYFTLQNQEIDRKNLFRAQSVALLQFLLKNSDNLQKVENFIEFRQREIEEKKAFVEAFQISLAKLSQEFSNYPIEKDKINYSSEFLQTAKFETLPISEAKSVAVIADFLYYSGYLKESENLIEKSLKLEPNQTLALTTLALIKAKKFYYNEAEKFAEKAVEVESNNYLNHYRLALCLSKRGMTEFGFVSGYDKILANQIRENVEVAIELNPAFASAYSLFAFVNYVRNDELDLSLERIAQALKLAKGNHQFQLRLAELNLRKENFSDARKIALGVLQTTPFEGVKLYAQNTIQRIDATEYQLERIKNNNAKYVNDGLVTENPLSDEEIRKLREKATNDQIRVALRRPKPDEYRVFGSLKRIDCGKNKVDFLVTTPTGQIKMQSNSFDGISLLSLVEEMSDYRLGCGAMLRENNASIIYKKNSTKTDELISIEFVPKGFRL